MSENRAGRELPPPNSPTASTAYFENLKREFGDDREQNPRQFARRLANFVLSCPTSNDIWRTTGYEGQRISAMAGQHIFHDVVNFAFEQAALYPEVRTEFFEILDDHRDRTWARLFTSGHGVTPVQALAPAALIYLRTQLRDHTITGEIAAWIASRSPNNSYSNMSSTQFFRQLFSIFVNDFRISA